MNTLLHRFRLPGLSPILGLLIATAVNLPGADPAPVPGPKAASAPVPATVPAPGAPEVVILWPGGAPGAKGTEPTDIPKLDVYPVAVEKSCGTAVVVYPGGGYGGLAADHEGRQIAKFYNSFGVTAFVCTYRLGSKGYHHPIELNDAKRAVRWVRTNASKFGVKENRIGVIGFSAGGHLASTVGTLFDPGDAKAADPVDRVSSRPDFMVLCYPVISMSDSYMHRGSRNNLLGPEKDNEELAKQLSSHLNVTADTPPTFIFQTDEDTAVPAENAVYFYLALRKNKVPAEMHIYKPGPHGVGLMHGDPVLSTWGDHMEAWLRNQGFLASVERVAIEGTVTVNGAPVTWGGITFISENPHAPRVTARVAQGKFKLPASNGVVLGKNRMEVAYSSAIVPALTDKEAPAGVMFTTKASPKDDKDLTVEVKEGTNKLDLVLKWE